MKSKLKWLALPLIAILMVFIFSVAVIPTVQSEPKNIPIAWLNNDEGVNLPDQTSVNLGATFTQALLNEQNNKEQQTIRWVEVNSEIEFNRLLEQQEVYGGISFPPSFSQQQLSVWTEKPQHPLVEIKVSQAPQPSVTLVVQEALNSVTQVIERQLQQQMIEQAGVKQLPITPELALFITSPLEINQQIVYPVGEKSARGNAPVILFQPLWIATLIMSVFSTIWVKKEMQTREKNPIKLRLLQVLVGLIGAIGIGFSLTYFAQLIVGIEIEQPLTVGFFIGLAALSFFLMITSILAWGGLPFISIFVLLLFFGGPLLGLAPEMMPDFYEKWIYPWLPMRFLTEGLKNLFYIQKELSFDQMKELIAIAVSGFMILMTSVVKPIRSK